VTKATTEARSARHFLISGRVQGVSYRATARRRALALGLCGWVRNLASGQVELWAEGTPAALEALATWCAQGPEGARVDGVEVREVEPSGCEGFEQRLW